MQIHFTRFEGEREYTLMVYVKELEEYINETIPEAKPDLKDELLEFSAHLLNELGVYMTQTEV